MFFSLYTTSIITLGYSKACLYDLERSVSVHIPKDMGEFFIDHKQFEIESVKNKYPEEESNHIIDCVNFLVENKFGMISQFLPTIRYILESEQIDKPFLYESLIVDADSPERMQENLNNLPDGNFFRFKQLRLFFEPELPFLNKLTSLIHVKDFFNTEMILNYKEGLHPDDYNSLFLGYPYHISRIIIMDYALDTDLSDYPRLITNPQKFSYAGQCGIIDEELFSINIESYLRAQTGNSCLHRKISVDNKGYIKNCPSFDFHYGKINDKDIAKVFDNKKYQFISGIKKTDVEECKDCEFRMICTDCRARRKNNDNIFSKPAGCTYSPYTN